MSWFDDHKDELEAANIPESAARDFISRNAGHEGQGGDYDRIISALGPDYARSEEESSGSGQSSGDGRSGDGLSGAPRPYQPFQYTAPRPYQPFTETYAAPTWGKTFTAPTRPGDLLDKWTGTFAFDPAKIADNPAYQVRLSDMIKSVDRGSAAKGLSFTNQAREEVLQRAGALASAEVEKEIGGELNTQQTK